MMCCSLFTREIGSVKTFSLRGPNLKKRFKDFTQTQFASTNVASAIKVYNQTMDSKKIINTVDIYEGDILEPWNWCRVSGSTTTLVSPIPTWAPPRKRVATSLTMDLLEMRFNQMPAGLVSHGQRRWSSSQRRCNPRTVR